MLISEDMFHNFNNTVNFHSRYIEQCFSFVFGSILFNKFDCSSDAMIVMFQLLVQTIRLLGSAICSIEYCLYGS